MSRRKAICFAAVSVVAITAGTMLYLHDSGDTGETQRQNAGGVHELASRNLRKQDAKKFIPAKAGRKKFVAKSRTYVSKTKPIIFAEDVDDLPSAISSEERELLRELQSALDADSFVRVKKAAEQINARCVAMSRSASVLSSDALAASAAVRRKALDALSWFGAAALPEITSFLGDSDPETAQEALSRWEEAVSNVDDDMEKAKVVILASQVLEDVDALDAIQMHLTMLGDESIACQACLDILDSGTETAKSKAKEQLDFITGEEFETVEQVQAWMEEYKKNNTFFEFDDDI